jgi:ABC-type phosphate transport system substrate-binding protein
MTKLIVISKESRRTAFAFLMFVLSSPAWADVKVHGSTTVAFALMKLHKAEIEQLAGVEITVLPSSSTHGLADLVEGRADIVMLTEPLEATAVATSSSYIRAIPSRSSRGLSSPDFTPERSRTGPRLEAIIKRS